MVHSCLTRKLLTTAFEALPKQKLLQKYVLADIVKDSNYNQLSHSLMSPPYNQNGARVYQRGKSDKKHMIDSLMRIYKNKWSTFDHEIKNKQLREIPNIDVVASISKLKDTVLKKSLSFAKPNFSTNGINVPVSFFRENRLVEITGKKNHLTSPVLPNSVSIRSYSGNNNLLKNNGNCKFVRLYSDSLESKEKDINSDLLLCSKRKSDQCEKKPPVIKKDDPCKEDPCKKKEDPCKKKEDPCKKKEDPCKKKEDPCKKKEDPCKKKEDPCKKKEDPCKKKEDPCKKKEDPCKKKEDPCKKNEDPCKKKKVPCIKNPCKKKEDPCKKDPCKKKEDPCKKDPCKKKEDPCKKKEDPCKKKEDPCKKDPCKKKEDPCKKKEDPCKKKEDPCKKVNDPCKRKPRSPCQRNPCCKPMIDPKKKLRDDPCPKKNPCKKICKDDNDPCKKRPRSPCQKNPCCKPMKNPCDKVKDDPCPKEDACKKKEDPCKKEECNDKKDACKGDDPSGKPVLAYKPSKEMYSHCKMMGEVNLHTDLLTEMAASCELAKCEKTQSIYSSAVTTGSVATIKTNVIGSATTFSAHSQPPKDSKVRQWNMKRKPCVNGKCGDMKRNQYCRNTNIARTLRSKTCYTRCEKKKNGKETHNTTT